MPTETADDGDDGADLLEKAKVDPESVGLDDLLAALHDDPEPPDSVTEAFQHLLAAGEVDPEEAADRFVSLTAERENYQVRLVAARLAADLSSEYPEPFSTHLDFLVDTAATDDLVCDQAMLILNNLTREEPDAVLPAIDRFDELLDRETPIVRGGALDILVFLSADSPDADRFAGLLPSLVDVVTEERPTDPFGTAQEPQQTPDQVRQQLEEEQIRQQQMREQAAIALSQIVGSNPATFEPYLTAALDVIDDPEGNSFVKELLADAVWAVASTDPETVLEADGVDRFTAILSRRAETAAVSTGLQASAARVLGALAEVNGQEVADAVVTDDDAFAVACDLLDADEPQERGSATSLFAYVAEFHPEAATTVHEELLDCLDDDNQGVRGSALWALRFLTPHLNEDARDAVFGALETVAAEDPDADIKYLAADTLEALKEETDEPGT